MRLSILRDAKFHGLLLRYDHYVAGDAKKAGCSECGGVLHVAHFPRKPRGIVPVGLPPEYERRDSFCCARDGCRSRHTPASLRFLGRKVYFGAVVVLVSAMRHGITAARLNKLSQVVGVSRRTLERWRDWWQEAFPGTPFWRVTSASFMPPVRVAQLPASLLERLGGGERMRLPRCLRFLGPISGGASATQAVRGW